MIEFDMNLQHGVLTLHPAGELTDDDVHEIRSAIEPVLEHRGRLQGLMVRDAGHEDWDGLADFLARLGLGPGSVGRLALVADAEDAQARLVRLAEAVGGCDAKTFASGLEDEAWSWLVD